MLSQHHGSGSQGCYFPLWETSEDMEIRSQDYNQAGPTGVVAEMLKAAGETGTLWVTDVCKAGTKDGEITEN